MRAQGAQAAANDVAAAAVHCFVEQGKRLCAYESTCMSAV